VAFARKNHLFLVCPYSCPPALRSGNDVKAMLEMRHGRWWGFGCQGSC